MASRRTFLIKAFATAGGLGIAALALWVFRCRGYQTRR